MDIATQMYINYDNTYNNMKKPNKKDYLTTNQIEYGSQLNKYYDALEEYAVYLESIIKSYAEFCIVCERKGLPLLDLESYINLK